MGQVIDKMDCPQFVFFCCPKPNIAATANSEYTLFSEHCLCSGANFLTCTGLKQVVNRKEVI